MSVALHSLTLASQLDAWPHKGMYLPSFFTRSRYINLEQALNECRLADGTFLKDTEANTNLGKAYRYWYMAPTNMNEWANLGLDAPQEVALIGRYLKTVQRLNGEKACENDPEWMRRKFSCTRSLVCVFILAGIIALITTGIFLTIKYYKK